MFVFVVVVVVVVIVVVSVDSVSVDGGGSVDDVILVIYQAGVSPNSIVYDDGINADNIGDDDEDKEEEEEED